MMMIVAIAVVYQDGKVLLTQRPDHVHLGGQWELPGGKLEQGEAPLDAVVRECLEECQIEIKVLDILDVTFHRYDEKEMLLLFYECEHVSGEVKHIAVSDHVWVDPENILDYVLPPADINVQHKIAQGIRRKK